VRVHVVDPSAYTPPYDHALCRSLAAAGAAVELYTSRFAHGELPPAEGYARREAFYGLAARVSSAPARRAVKLAEHVPEMLRYRRLARSAEVVHFQWLPVQQLDAHLLPGRRSRSGARRPLLLTAHDILPREPRAGQSAAQARLYERFDAVVVHSEHGRRRLTDELGVDPAKVHVIPHGAFGHLASPAVAGEAPAPPEDGRPVVLCFGLMRPYKGIDLLLEAWRGVEGAELWIVGMPRMEIERLVSAAPGNVRFVARFVSDAELAGYFRAADLLVLPYREIDQSGVLYTGLAFGKPLLLSDVGGFPEIAATGSARLFPSGDASALRRALSELLGDPDELTRMAASAREAAAGAYSWDTVAARTLALYRTLLGRDGEA
jgi:glycosyltransferase involved in cell wall biosynthesis